MSVISNIKLLQESYNKGQDPRAEAFRQKLVTLVTTFIADEELKYTGQQHTSWLPGYTSEDVMVSIITVLAEHIAAFAVALNWDEQKTKELLARQGLNTIMTYSQLQQD